MALRFFNSGLRFLIDSLYLYRSFVATMLPSTTSTTREPTTTTTIKTTQRTTPKISPSTTMTTSPTPSNTIMTSETRTTKDKMQETTIIPNRKTSERPQDQPISSIRPQTLIGRTFRANTQTSMSMCKLNIVLKLKFSIPNII